jgi:predicted MFS family arabinose efflux permease
MKCGMPNSVLAGWFAVALFVVYQAVGASTRLVRGFPPSPAGLLYLAGGALFLVGIWRGSRLAWRAGLAVVAIVGSAAAGCAAVFLSLSLRDPTWFLPNGSWALFVAMYSYAVVHLLRRPASRSYFTPGKGG